MQVAHEAAHGQPEVVAHQDHRLDPLPVALPERLGEFGVLPSLGGVKPLLELVEDDEHLLALAHAPPLRRAAIVPVKSRSPGAPGQRFRSPLSSRASVSAPVAST